MKFRGKVIFAFVYQKSMELNFVSFVTDLGTYLMCIVKLALEQTIKAQEGSRNIYSSFNLSA